MKPRAVQLVRGLLLAAAVAVAVIYFAAPPATPVPPGREEVEFWHFWGGADRAVVEEVVGRFNSSQDRYFVRAVAMPGNNLDLKVFLAVTGGDPPDLINQDDPIVADWASRGALLALDEFVPAEELAPLPAWLVPAAVRLGSYDNRLYALCNGLDIRALYYDRGVLESAGFVPPRTREELDRIAEATTEIRQGQVTRFGFLPDARRLWAWGIVFGGNFYDPQTRRATVDDPRIVDALAWMSSYRLRYGAATLAAYRQGDQSLPGKTFPLLAGRYTLVMDGQWRVRDIANFQQELRSQGLPAPEFGVCPLPPPPGGRQDAGWVNGNFFVVPRNARQPEGAWAFMKFWSGYGGFAAEAAETCAAGGWIPVSSEVVEQPRFQRFLEDNPLFRVFVRLSASPNQFPTPVVPGAPRFFREVNDAAAQMLLRDELRSPREVLQQADRAIDAHLDRVGEGSHGDL